MSEGAFRGRVVIVTGASSGIGAALVHQLCAAGANVVLAARTVPKLEALAAGCPCRGDGEALAVPTDVSERDQCRALVEAAVGAFGRIDVLINNAAAGMWARFDELQDLDIIERIMRVNYLGSVYCTAYALPHLKAAGGRIGVVNSLAGKTGVPSRTGYAASKHALCGFFDSLRIELAESGVSVTTVYPGFVATGFHERIVGPDGEPLGKDHPVDYRRAASSGEVAAAVLRALAGRRREVVLTARGRVGQFVRLIAPRLIDRIALRAIETGR
jgi:NAD(P)-dependent dehydrogenase (short-subunit alcohol dehydrogenase family)